MQIRYENLPIQVAHTQIDIALSELVKYARNVESARILGYTDNFTLPIGTVTVSFRIADWKANVQLLAPTSKRILPGCRHPGLAQDMCALPQLIALIACRIHIVGLSQEASFLLLRKPLLINSSYTLLIFAATRATLTSSALENRPMQQFWIIVPRASVLIGGKLPCWKSSLISLSPRSLQGFWPVRISYNRLPILNTSPSLLPCTVSY
ncbi:hypothetical protein HBH56_084520 [Parastagonospora nodorum]|uniref:Uncharacterized protein n=1 Tax=Phaeosphaeria nodorum (strain SN15 / ATCC MYA-4574 / FGSC 10173) TaxID=321614 RepID=A0A7U2I2C4_PHANO|nr:hypothetical protein HBH56_084520 [Parastagonospora nodorum]QRC96822.1 hypothetical protein JI435_301080 [Parastagonospora nodorum SN15]KAH3929985.1 hypothetical protein HBH54_117320 [Parastagonospora nodorum]KAH4138036.1 hypothetical protein HBH45_111040 [Parastagonospora nodorum]KAH4154012.1 hypothetical protein HBH44_149250 [Parastagonospora nodorum]